MASKSSVKEFALIGFLLLAVLFGMQIVTFIFGNLSSIDYISDQSINAVNETGAFVNATGYTLNAASYSNYTGASISSVWANVSNTGYLIPAANYSFNSATGVLTNATEGPVRNATEYNDCNITYVWTSKTDQEVISDRTINDSLGAIGNYASQSGTQFTTLGIAVTLIILVAVFVFFWKAFMGKKGEGSAGNFG